MPRRKKSIKRSFVTTFKTCSPKRQYINEKEAIEASEYQMLLKPSLDLSVYQCEMCHKWHLTRREVNNKIT